MNFKTDLGLSSQQYYDCVMIFCESPSSQTSSSGELLTQVEVAGYLACVFPANLLIRKVGPNLQLGSAVILFGLFVCCMCAARGSADVLGLRFGIGGAEALLQAVPIYMMMWYGKHEIGKRIGKSKILGPSFATRLTDVQLSSIRQQRCLACSPAS